MFFYVVHLKKTKNVLHVIMHDLVILWLTRVEDDTSIEKPSFPRERGIIVTLDLTKWWLCKTQLP